MLSSIIAWAAGVLVLAFTMWQDANYSGPRNDVAAGLAGFAFVVGFGVFLVSTAIGVLLGVLATRRAPEWRSADVALGLNVVTLAGVLVSTALLLIL